jgi:hypothetical protein
MKKSVMAALFTEHQDAFLENITHRFRCTGQFLPQSLHNHACIRDGSATLLEAQDYLHLAAGMFEDQTLDQVQSEMRTAATDAIKFLCVNDLPELEQHIGNARAWIEQTIGVGAGAVLGTLLTG